MLQTLSCKERVCRENDRNMGGTAEKFVPCIEESMQGFFCVIRKPVVKMEMEDTDRK